MQLARIHTGLLAALLCSLPIQGCNSSPSNFTSPSANVRADAPADSQSDEVLDWTRIMLQSLQTANVTNATTTIYDGALVESAIFDAVNGVKGPYASLHVAPAAPKGASARAAAVEAAYTVLLHLFPSQKADLDAARTTSLNNILNVNGGVNLQSGVQASVNDGVAWGQQVANQIIDWRSTDGFSTVVAPFVGGTAIGQWRPIPPATSGANPQIATMTPYVISAPSQFRPAGPPALDSALYAKVYNETKSMGAANSPLRTADQTLYAKFWQNGTPTSFWDGLFLRLAANDGLNMVDHAHILALMHVAMGDAMIGCWDAKYHYAFWRPITAIQNGNSDNNPDTAGDTSWTPLISPTPSHPEYPSAHSCFSSSATTVLASFYGENANLTVDTWQMPGVTRSFTSFGSALDEVENARIYGGIHFRTATSDGTALGKAVANYVLQNAMLPGHGNGAFDGN